MYLSTHYTEDFVAMRSLNLMFIQIKYAIPWEG